MDEEWQPPSEAEMKVIQARRERSDKISSLMGDYLLKGYKMLASICSVCGTVLLQDKQNKVICIACSEVDSENAKDNPALSDEAARSQVMESQSSLTPSRNLSRTLISCSTPIQDHPEPDLSISESVQVNIVGSNQFRSNSSSVVLLSHHKLCLEQTYQSLMNKITWASEQLQTTDDTGKSIEYSRLIKSCADAMISISSIKP